MKLDANTIKHSITQLDFYRHVLPGVKLNRAEWNDGGLCPFHSDHKPGSFRVNLQSGAFTCFACGTKGGDIVAFTMTLQGASFRESLVMLTQDWGL